MKTYLGYKPHQVQAVFYLSLGLGLGVLALQVYVGGFYQAVLLPSMLTTVYLALGITRLQKESLYKQDPAAILALICLAVFIAFQPDSSYSDFNWYWAGLFYPILAFLLLPTLSSLAFSLLLLAAILWLHLLSLSLGQMLEFIAHYLLLTFLAWAYVLHAQLHTGKLMQVFGIDSITGFYNRQLFNQHLVCEVDRAQKLGSQLTALLIELHQYPQMLQEFGAGPAQEFLQEASKICNLNCRIGDSAYRYDEQTLLLLMPNTTVNGALVLRMRLYQHLLQEIICDAGPLDLTITPITLQKDESLDSFQERLAASCYHSLNARVKATLS